MCKKHHHRTMLQAQGQALSLHKHKGQPLESMRVYECDKCGCYHVSKMSLAAYLKRKNN